MITGLARVTISAPQRRVDVALPEQIPLVELLPEVLRHAGESLADDGEQHGGWVLRRTDGAVLANPQSLLAQGVRDGEVLHLVPARAQWPELEYDDVVEAIADGARRRGGAWSVPATRRATVIAAGVLSGIGLLAVLAAGPGQLGAVPVALTVAGLLALAGTVASRAYGDGLAGAALAAYGLPFAFVGGGLFVASGDRVGVAPLLPWLGAPELLAGSVALLLVAVVGLVGVASRLRIFVAGAVVGLVGALTALLGFVVSAGGTAAILLTALVFLVGALPLVAIRLGKVPMPPITLPTGASAEAAFTGATPNSVRDLPDRARVFAAVARSEEMLSGMVFGHGVLATFAAGVLVLAGGTWGRILVAVAAGALLLRSRLFVAVRHRVPLLSAGLAGYGLLSVGLVVVADPTGLLALVAGGLVCALVAVGAGARFADRAPSPYLGRAADLVETVMVVSVVPVACAVLGLYAQARGLLS